MQALFSLISLIVEPFAVGEGDKLFNALRYLGNFHRVLKCFTNISELKLNPLLLIPKKQLQFKDRANETKTVVLC